MSSEWNHTTVSTVEGWEVRATTLPDHAYVRVTAISADRQRVLKVAKMATERLATWVPVWARQ